jgi:hypothetical protein
MPRTYTAEQKARKAQTSAAYYQRNKTTINVSQADRQRAWKKANPEKIKAYQAKHQPHSTAKQHGLTVELVQLLITAQRGLCAVCDKPLAAWPSRSTHVDHNHATGEVRGVLCSSCNRHEGWVSRNGVRLAAYLETPPARRLLELL